MAYGDIIEYEGKRYRDITPNLTSNTTPAPYYANASGEYIYNAQTRWGHAYCVFSDPPKGVAQEKWGWSPSSPPNWIGIGMGQPINIDLVKIMGNKKPRTITLYGSNNRVEMNAITTFTHNFGEFMPFYLKVDSKTAYSYYRIHTSSNGGNGWNGFDAIRFYQKVSDERYLLSDSGLKTIKDNTLTALDATEPTKALFEQDGFASLSSIAAIIDQLSNQFDLLRYSPDSANTAITITHLPTDQLITAVDAVDLSAYATVKQIAVKTTGTKGIVKNVLKKVTGGGIFWKTFSGGAWQDIEPTPEAVAAQGIPPDVLEAITPKQWAEVLTGPVYFAFYLAKSATTDDLAVDSLSITGDTEYWALASDDDATWGYPAADTLQVRLLTNGSYKINYFRGDDEVKEADVLKYIKMLQLADIKMQIKYDMALHLLANQCADYFVDVLEDADNMESFMGCAYEIADKVIR